MVRLEDDWVPMDEQLGAAELEEILRAKEAHSSAVVLESVRIYRNNHPIVQIPSAY